MNECCWQPPPQFFKKKNYYYYNTLLLLLYIYNIIIIIYNISFFFLCILGFSFLSIFRSFLFLSVPNLMNKIIQMVWPWSKISSFSLDSLVYCMARLFCQVHKEWLLSSSSCWRVFLQKLYLDPNLWNFHWVYTAANSLIQTPTPPEYIIITETCPETSDLITIRTTTAR